MCIACFILKATDTHTQYVILIALPLQQWLYDTPQCYGISTFACLVTYILWTMLTNATTISFHF